MPSTSEAQPLMSIKRRCSAFLFCFVEPNQPTHVFPLTQIRAFLTSVSLTVTGTCSLRTANTNKSLHSLNRSPFPLSSMSSPSNNPCREADISVSDGYYRERSYFNEATWTASQDDVDSQVDLPCNEPEDPENGEAEAIGQMKDDAGEDRTILSSTILSSSTEWETQVQSLRWHFQSDEEPDSWIWGRIEKKLTKAQKSELEWTKFRSGAESWKKAWIRLNTAARSYDAAEEKLRIILLSGHEEETGDALQCLLTAIQTHRSSE